MKTICVAVVMLALAASGSLRAEQRDTPASADNVWRTYAERLPIGSTVKIRTTTGERVTAVLMDVDDTGMTVKPKARFAVPARHLSFDAIDSLDLPSTRVSMAKYAGLGAAIGAAVFLWLLSIGG